MKHNMGQANYQARYLGVKVESEQKLSRSWILGFHIDAVLNWMNVYFSIAHIIYLVRISFSAEEERNIGSLVMRALVSLVLKILKSMFNNEDNPPHS